LENRPVCFSNLWKPSGFFDDEVVAFRCDDAEWRAGGAQIVSAVPD
jgi:hypothetical protein